MIRLLFYYDYIGGACRQQKTRNPEYTEQGEGVDLEMHPTGWKQDGDNFTGCEIVHNWPGLDTTTHMSHAHIVEALKEVPKMQYEGTVWRGNELGIIVNNDIFWEHYGVNPVGISLGSSVNQHMVVRPILDELLGDVNDQLAAALEESAKSYIGKINVSSDRSINALKDPSIWVHRELLKILFPSRDASEFTNAVLFFNVQSDLVQFQTLSQLVSDSTARQLPGKEGKTLVENVEDIFKVYFPIVNETYGERLAGEDCSPSASCVHQLTATILDTLFFAGGLSVPSAIFTALWVLYADHHDEITQLPNGTKVQTFPQNLLYNRNDPSTFFWESIRFFPPVLGFPWWTQKPEIATCTDDPVSCNQFNGGVREIQLLGLGQRDPNAWGMDASLFRVRRISEYAKSVGFADFAKDDSIANGAMNRNCPAKKLALQLGIAWFKAFDQTAYCYQNNRGNAYRLVTPFIDRFSIVPAETCSM